MLLSNIWPCKQDRGCREVDTGRSTPDKDAISGRLFPSLVAYGYGLIWRVPRGGSIRSQW